MDDLFDRIRTAHTQEDFDQAIFDLRRSKQRVLWENMCPSGQEVSAALRAMDESTPLYSVPSFYGPHSMDLDQGTPIVSGFVYYHPRNAQILGGPVYIEKPGSSVPIRLELEIESIFEPHHDSLKLTFENLKHPYILCRYIAPYLPGPDQGYSHYIELVGHNPYYTGNP